MSEQRTWSSAVREAETQAYVSFNIYVYVPFGFHEEVPSVYGKRASDVLNHLSGQFKAREGTNVAGIFIRSVILYKDA